MLKSAWIYRVLNVYAKGFVLSEHSYTNWLFM